MWTLNVYVLTTSKCIDTIQSKSCLCTSVHVGMYTAFCMNEASARGVFHGPEKMKRSFVFICVDLRGTHPVICLNINSLLYYKGSLYHPQGLQLGSLGFVSTALLKLSRFGNPMGLPFLVNSWPGTAIYGFLSNTGAESMALLPWSPASTLAHSSCCHPSDLFPFTKSDGLAPRTRS